MDEMLWLKDALEADVFPELELKGFRCHAEYRNGSKLFSLHPCLVLDFEGGSNQSPAGVRIAYFADDKGRARCAVETLLQDPRKPATHPQNVLLRQLTDLYTNQELLRGTDRGDSYSTSTAERLLQAVFVPEARSVFYPGSIDPEQADVVRARVVGSRDVKRAIDGRAHLLSRLEMLEPLHRELAGTDFQRWPVSLFSEAFGPRGFHRIAFAPGGQTEYRIELCVERDGQLRSAEFVPSIAHKFGKELDVPPGTSVKQALQHAGEWLQREELGHVRQARFEGLTERLTLNPIKVTRATQNSIEVTVAAPTGNPVSVRPALENEKVTGISKDPVKVLKALFGEGHGIAGATLVEYLKTHCEALLDAVKEVQQVAPAITGKRTLVRGAAGFELKGADGSTHLFSIATNASATKYYVFPASYESTLWVGRLQQQVRGTAGYVPAKLAAGTLPPDTDQVAQVIACREFAKLEEREKAAAKAAKKQRDTGR
ncbi:hypothetical protein [Ramlibacter alkalitolerans]|uniref:Uncharacterized protein n=1 Tax=Ramlibacter alkalitolerans TaxID=2039631 RepID=A0ABS1JUR3_9BURK|nr:hypothetical protein [Ramlibacter alkalitolerans]MBL0427871.1 hypothetical protein [Ramlibacter alkalitolerans]